MPAHRHSHHAALALLPLLLTGCASGTLEGLDPSSPRESARTEFIDRPVDGVWFEMHRAFIALLLLLGVLWAGPLAAQATAGLQLRVIDEAGAPVPGAQVAVFGTRVAGTTDPRGLVGLGDIPVGDRVVEVSRLGFRTERFPVTFAAGESAGLEVVLASQSVELTTIRVEAERTRRALERSGFYTRERMGFGKFLTREQIMARNPFWVTDAVQGVRRTYVKPNMKAATGVEILQRRFGQWCRVDVWLDGSLATADDLNRYRPDMIEALEVYDGSEIPFRFSTNMSNQSVCGAVVVWTRPDYGASDQ